MEGEDERKGGCREVEMEMEDGMEDGCEVVTVGEGEERRKGDGNGRECK